MTCCSCKKWLYGGTVPVRGYWSQTYICPKCSKIAVVVCLMTYGPCAPGYGIAFLGENKEKLQLKKRAQLVRISSTEEGYVLERITSSELAAELIPTLENVFDKNDLIKLSQLTCTPTVPID